VQHALAREHGYPGWPAMKAATERRLDAARDAGASALALYETMASALLEAYRTGTPEAMERHYSYTWHRRAWHAMRTYVQLDLGKRPAGPEDDVEITLNDARHLVAREHGFANWSELEAFTRSAKAGPRVAAKPARLVRREGPGDWQTVASSRDWDEILRLLAAHPSAGLSAEGQMTDGLLAEVSRVETLTALGLSGCKAVTDEGVRHLARLRALQHLDLSGTSVTDAGLQVLRDLPELRTLSLAWTRVTEEGIGALAHCHELERVNLFVIPRSGDPWPARTGDAALRAMAGKRQLRHLEIALSDAGLALLHELPVFKYWHEEEPELSLRDCRISSRCAAHSPTAVCSTCGGSTACSASTSATRASGSRPPASSRSSPCRTSERSVWTRKTTGCRMLRRCRTCVLSARRTPSRATTGSWR
jgi:hypothetical protein